MHPIGKQRSCLLGVNMAYKVDGLLVNVESWLNEWLDFDYDR